MRRRAFLASAGLAALAGCSNGDESTPTPTVTETTAGSGSANFELRGAKFPEARALNNPTTFAIGVRNTGSAAGTFTTTLETKVGDGEWQSAGGIEMSLKAGETGEWHSPRFVPQYLTTLHYRLAAFDETWSIEVVPKRLDFGNFYAVPTNLYINVLGGSFESEYPVPDETTTNETATNETATNETATNGTTTATPDPTPTTPTDGDEWVVMEVDVRNRLEESQTAPPASSFVLEVGGERRPMHQEVTDAPYEGGELGGRTVRRGELVYAVPAGTQARDLTLTWEQSLPKGDVKAVWTK